MKTPQKYRKKYNKIHTTTEPIPNNIHKTKIKQKQYCNEPRLNQRK
jgi:hypothetical protein